MIVGPLRMSADDIAGYCSHECYQWSCGGIEHRAGCLLLMHHTDILSVPVLDRNRNSHNACS